MSPSSLPIRSAFLGGYEPRRCGIATFTHDLCEAVAAVDPRADCFAIAMNDRDGGYEYPERVRFGIQEEDPDSYRRAADFLNRRHADVLCVQHEFGIYGGPAGSHLLSLLREARMPVVSTLHTILENPDAAQRRVMNGLAMRSDRLVVMARKGCDILRKTYGVPVGKIDVIPHGIPDVAFEDSRSFKERIGMGGRMVLMTFGLLGPGKGIEHVIMALPQIVARHPEAVYLIVGATHPHLLAREGEAYRLGLERLSRDLGVDGHVIFHNCFVPMDELRDFTGATDIYLTPYPNEAQITSGTLARMFGAGKAVVSTPYWHARELLADGRGALVPFRDPGAIADAVCAFLDDPALLERTRRAAYLLGRTMTWQRVADAYLQSFRRACAGHKTAPRKVTGGWLSGSRRYELPPRRLDHILRMSNGNGIYQHAVFNEPNTDEGYCTDDNARAFILCNLLAENSGGHRHPGLHHLSHSSLAFMAAALDPESGRFRNFMSHSCQWLEDAGSEDSHGRALWALGTGASRSPDAHSRAVCSRLFARGLMAVESFTSPRAWAFTLLGIREFLRGPYRDHDARRMMAVLTHRIADLWRACATDDWMWFETSVTYENARLCQAMLVSGQCMSDPEVLKIGLESLGWLASLQETRAGHFRPVGSDGFYQKGGERADFDQQPVEAQAMVSASLEAFRCTGDGYWVHEARRAFEWFLGRNDLGLPLLDPGSGACGDGLHRDRVNENHGAESTLAFHLALAEMQGAEHPVIRSPSHPTHLHESTPSPP